MTVSGIEGLPKELVRNALAIWDMEDGVQELDLEHYSVRAIKTPSRRVRVYWNGDLWRCKVDRRYNSDKPCGHILAVLLYRGDVTLPDSSSTVYRKTGEPRNHSLEEQAHRAFASMVPELAAKLLRACIQEFGQDLDAPTGGRPRCKNYAKAYQAIMRVVNRRSLRALPGSLDLANHREHNPWGPVSRDCLSRWHMDPATKEFMEKVLAASTYPAKPYETLLHPDGTGLATELFTSFYEEKHHSKSERREHDWRFNVILWTYRYTLIAAIKTHHGPLGEAQWLIPLMERARLTLDSKEVGGDKAYMASYIFEYARLNGIEAQIKFKKNAKPMHYAKNRGYKEAFEAARLDRDGYAAKSNRRNNAESGNHAFKALLGDCIYSKNQTAQEVETLCMAVAYNLHRLVYLHFAEGVEIDFAAGAAAVARSEWVSLGDLHKQFYKRPTPNPAASSSGAQSKTQ